MKDIHSKTPPGGGGKPGNGGSCKPGSPSPGGTNVLTSLAKHETNPTVLHSQLRLFVTQDMFCQMFPHAVRGSAKSTELAVFRCILHPENSNCRSTGSIKPTDVTFRQFKTCKINSSWRSPVHFPAVHRAYSLQDSACWAKTPEASECQTSLLKFLCCLLKCFLPWALLGEVPSIFHIFKLSDLKDNKCWTWGHLEESEGSQHLRRPAKLGTLTN